MYLCKVLMCIQMSKSFYGLISILKNGVSKILPIWAHPYHAIVAVSPGSVFIFWAPPYKPSSFMKQGIIIKKHRNLFKQFFLETTF